MKHLKYKGEKTSYGINKKGNVHFLFEDGRKCKPRSKSGKITEMTTGTLCFHPNGRTGYNRKDLMAIAEYIKKHEQA